MIGVKQYGMEVRVRERGEERRGANRMLERKPEAKRSLGRPRRSWEDNMKCVLKQSVGTKRTGLIWLRIGNGRETRGNRLTNWNNTLQY
jgi:hypothetical protein